MNQPKTLISTLTLLLSVATVQAQNALTTAGGEASSEAGTVSYTIGQAAASYALSDGGSLTAGVQQSYIIKQVAPPDGVAELQAEFKVYPNPTTDAVSVTTTDSDDYSFELHTEAGAIVKKGDFDESCMVEMSAFVPSTYMLRISNKKGQMKVFRIVKQ